LYLTLFLFLAVGSGGTFALSAALALIDQPNVDAETIVRKAMKIAGDICVYTNHNLTVESIDIPSTPTTTTTSTSTETVSTTSDLK